MIIRGRAAPYDEVKPGGGKLAVAKRGESVSDSGQALPVVIIEAQDCTRRSMSITARESEGTVVAFYQDYATAERKEVSVGEGDPVRRLRHNFPDEESAAEAAQSELDKRTRQRNILSLSMPGDPMLTAETKL